MPLHVVGGTPYFPSASNIPSGVYLGPAIPVGDETWDWSATRNRYVPGEKVSKSTYADLTTLATQMGLGNNAASIGVKCGLTNSLSPEGITRMYWTGTLWAPVSGQVLASEVGAPLLLDLVASALTIGTLTEVYQSAILPDWFFPNNRTLMIDAEFGTYDSSSTANVQAAAGVSSAAFPNTNAAIALSTTNNANGKGCGSPRVRIRRDGTTIRGQTGTSLQSGGTFNTSVGTFAAGAMRFRFAFSPGATTNVVRIASWSLVAGY